MKRNWFWFVLVLFPFIAFVAVILFDTGGIQMTLDSNVSSLLGDFFGAFSIPAFTSVYTNIFDSISWTMPQWLICVVSYATGILMLRIVYEVIVFLPRFCISVFERRMK